MLNTIDVLDDLEKFVQDKAGASGVTLIEGVLEDEDTLTMLHLTKDGTEGVTEFFTACKTLGVKLVAAVFSRLEEEDWDSRLEDSRGNDDHEDIVAAIEECKEFIGNITLSAKQIMEALKKIWGVNGEGLYLLPDNVERFVM